MLSLAHKTAGKIKISGKLKKAYKILGAIRDLQLQQQRMPEAIKQEPDKPQAYLNLLQKEIDELKAELSKLFLQNPVTENKKKTDSLVPDEFPLNSFRYFVQQKEATVTGIIVSGHFRDDNFHTIRKTLKDLFYNLKIYKGIEHDLLSLSVWKGKDEQYFDPLLDELGNFQDKCTAIGLLNANRLNNLNEYDREPLERIKKEWRKDKAGMKQLMVNKWKNDVSPVADVPKLS